MTNITEYIRKAHLSCNSCDFASDDTGECMMHALHTHHSLSGVSDEGSEITISIEQE